MEHEFDIVAHEGAKESTYSLTEKGTGAVCTFYVRVGSQGWDRYTANFGDEIPEGEVDLYKAARRAVKEYRRRSRGVVCQ